jgi:hypothetical protein
MTTRRAFHFLSLLCITALTTASFTAVPASPALPADAAQTAPSDMSSDWLAAAQENIRQAEYHIVWRETTYLPELTAAYQAPNREQNLRLYFTPQGLVIIPRLFSTQDNRPPWRLDLELSSWGWQGALQPPAPPKLELQETALEYQRGALSEWYHNGQRGLEQGFTIPLPSGSAPTAGCLLLELSISGDLQPALDASSQAIEFSDPRGEPVLRYGGLKAWDASGRELPTGLALAGAGLQLSILADGAAFPIRLDPVITGLQNGYHWYDQGEAAGDHFGQVVATAGDVNGDSYSDVIIGAPDADNGGSGRGTIYVYYGDSIELSDDPDWVEEGTVDNAHFGYSVATAGDVDADGYSDVIVASPYWESEVAQADEGSIWIIKGGAGGLSHTSCAQKQVNQSGANLGYSVASAGDVDGDGHSDVIIGAPYFNNGQANEGVVWVWRGDDTCITDVGLWYAESNQADAWFGQSVAWAGDVNADGYSDVIIGAPDYTEDWSHEGTAYVWHGSAGGLNGGTHGSPTDAVWQENGGDINGMYGWSVSTAGDVNGDGYSDVIVGAPTLDSGGNDTGVAAIYYGSSAGVSNSDEDYLYNLVEFAQFGWSVSTAGDVNGDGYGDVIVGAPLFTDGESREGRVWVWHGGPSINGFSSNWHFDLDLADAYFGKSVALAGDVNGDGYSDVIVGASMFTSDSLAERGRAFIFRGGPSSLSTTAGWIKSSSHTGFDFGFAVAGAGDVNGDGFADVAVGSPLWDDGQVNEGAVFVYAGSSTGMVAAPIWHKYSDKADAKFGYSLSSAGDVNNDGFDDLIVGAPFWDNGETEEGLIAVYAGDSSGLVNAPLWTKDSDLTYAHFGWSVASAGDANGDGFGDVIAGAPGWTQGTGQSAEGGAWVYIGSPQGPVSAPFWHVESNLAQAGMGFAVADAGDVNRDGYSDVLVGAPGWADDHTYEGRVNAYYGGRTAISTVSNWHAESNQDMGQMGAAISTAGDVNGDGYSDVIVATPYYDSSAGKAWVFHGSETGLESVAAWVMPSPQAGSHFGVSVDTAGDVNGDGFADVIVGADRWQYGGGLIDEGGAWVYYGGWGGVEDDPAWHDESDQNSANYGYSVAGVGDVNGDAYSDILVGAPDYTNTVDNEGQVFLYYGNGGKGRSLNLKQEKMSGDTLGRLGMMDDRTHLHLTIFGMTPFGKGKIRFNTECKKLSQFFETSNSYTAYASSEHGYVLNIGNLSPGTPHHWRVRVKYQTASVPFLVYSRWTTMPWNGWNEADFRTMPVLLYLPVVRK